ncbi:hypothetical protein [Thiobacillus denitrificans]|uniref:hypothetical protein n=1 Tax=Thiobacillus denitrificans TaxID=36861 RepID=UPI0012FAE587|nr:hypothetical protein [Thiobacillus denitrificans]
MRLEELSTEGELLWCASILSLYVEELNQFIKQRDGYYKAYADGDYDRAEAIIDKIQESFGFSLWLLGNRLLLRQVTKGLQAQKTLLEDVLSTEGINQFVAWITYFISVRAEDNVSYSSFEAELAEVLEIRWLRDYVRLHLLPYEFASIEDSGLPIAVEEPHPIIDRFETFVAMCLNACAKSKREELCHVLSALEQVGDIDDLSIRRMMAVLRDGYIPSQCGFLATADAYTEGRYQDILDSGCDGLELLSRAYGFLECRPQIDGRSCLRDQIVALMYDVSSLSSDASKSRQTLKKLALLCPDRSLTLEVTAFLQRTNDYVAADAPSDLDVAMALSRSLDNPWSTSALDRVCSGAPWLAQLSAAHPSSPALKLRRALTTGDVAAVERNEMLLPSYRQAMYVGHIRLRTGDFISAASHYSLAIDSSIDFISHAAKRALFKAYYANGQLYEAVQLAIDQALTTPSSAQSFPLEALARQYLNFENARSSIDLAVLLHLATRYGNAKLERDLSNIYENVMEAEGVDRPSALQDRVSSYNRDRLIYFLRYICVPRVLDDTTCFDSVEEIDLERISICQLLLEVDPQNVASYQAEIRAITRGSEVANLLCKMQTSKIYVDEAGIREVLEASLAESLARYLKLLSSPSLAYQAEKLSKRLSEMLSSKGHPEFKALKLPASELEGLFNAMLLEVISEFALNPAYGLDTHVSTSIRHGAFEGHLRRPLVIEDLLCLKKDKEYVLPSTWHRKLQNLTVSDFDLLQRQLAKFSQRFDEIVLEYLKGKLHVRLLGDDVAMFDFHAGPAETQSLMDGITPNTTLNDLADRLIAHCWHLTTRSLDAIRADLLNSAAKQIGSAFDTLVRGVESKIEHSTVTPFINAVARARTAFQIAIEDVADWFQRPTDLSRDPLDIEVATHVALQQIANCYVQNPIHPVLNLTIGEKIDGRMLDGLCEILFILLQNIILHSGLGEQRTEVFISARRQDESLILECKSKLGDEVSLMERRESAVEAMGRYERDSALKMARKEGGSGLSKVWRIAEFDLRVQHRIELSVTDDREFVVRLSLGGLWI